MGEIGINCKILPIFAVSNHQKVKVLFICNNDPYAKGNGLCTAVKLTIKHLRERGVETRLVSTVSPSHDGPQPEYPLPRFIFPVFQPLVEANCFCFARLDKNLVSEAVAWADVVHIEEPFPIQIFAIGEAERMGKAIVASFHLFTDNIFYNVRMGWCGIGNRALMNFWKKHVYDRCSHIHCPSKTVENLLCSYGFKAELRTFTNGVIVRPDRLENTSRPQAPYRILSIGRFSPEKNQILLLKAMRFSRHSKEIQLSFAGFGNLLSRLEKEGKRLLDEGVLKYRPHFGFYKFEHLSKIISESYLYYHGAVVEVEGLSCLEALRGGAVPVIADAPLAATKDFALSSESLFKSGDLQDLARKIDWWIEHPDEHAVYSGRYAALVSDYNIVSSIDSMIEMYSDAIRSARR